MSDVVTVCGLDPATGKTVEVNVNKATGALLVELAASAPAAVNQTPAGALTAASVIEVFTGAGKLDGARITYKGAGAVYLTVHDAADATAPATANMLGEGIPIAAAAPVLDWEPNPPIAFANGCKIAVSSTSASYTASADQITVWGRWS